MKNINQNQYVEKEIKIKIKYTKSTKSDNAYFGGVKTPRYTNELVFDIYNDMDFDLDTETFHENGKIGIEISGTNRSLKELGTYLINLSMYKTHDPDYHDHFDGLHDANKNPNINLTIRKSYPNM